MFLGFQFPIVKQLFAQVHGQTDIKLETKRSSSQCFAQSNTLFNNVFQSGWKIVCVFVLPGSQNALKRNERNLKKLMRQLMFWL